MKTPKTFLNLTQELNAARDKVHSIDAELRNIPGYIFINAAFMASHDDWFGNPADYLVDELVQRDYPMTKEEIIQVFEESGFDFEMTHIEACHPETKEQVDSWLSEEMSYLT